MSDTKRFDKVLGKFQEFKDKLSKYDEKRQDGVNAEPPMKATEKTKKAEFLAMSKHGQWKLDKAETKVVPPKPAPKKDATAVAPEADPAVAPAAAPAPAPAAAPVAAAPKGNGSGNSPTHTKTQTGGSSPGGASTGGVGSGIGGAGTGGAATGGASTGGAGTVTVTISGSSSTETSSGAGAKKGKGKGGEPAAPITLNISNVGGRTDAGNVASGDGPGAHGDGGSGEGSGGGGGGASPDEPDDYSTSRKDKVSKSVSFNQHGQWSLMKSDGKSSGSNPPKSENRKRAEKEIREISPTGEDPEKGAEEVDSAEKKRKYKAGQGSGASENRLHKVDNNKTGISAVDDRKKVMGKMDEGTTMAGDYNMTGIEKKDLPKDAEYQEHKKEPKDAGK